MVRRILVVDDDGDVRDVIMGMLLDDGFAVTTASGGDAMRHVLAGGSQVDAIVLDSLMPGEPGAALALHAKDRRIPVVMISGSPDSIKFAEEHGLQLLRKPFRITELRHAVETALLSGQFGQREA